MYRTDIQLVYRTGGPTPPIPWGGGLLARNTTQYNIHKTASLSLDRTASETWCHGHRKCTCTAHTCAEPLLFWRSMFNSNPKVLGDPYDWMICAIKWAPCGRLLLGCKANRLSNISKSFSKLSKMTTIDWFDSCRPQQFIVFGPNLPLLCWKNIHPPRDLLETWKTVKACVSVVCGCCRTSTATFPRRTIESTSSLGKILRLHSLSSFESQHVFWVRICISEFL